MRQVGDLARIGTDGEILAFEEVALTAVLSRKGLGTGKEGAVGWGWLLGSQAELPV